LISLLNRFQILKIQTKHFTLALLNISAALKRLPFVKNTLISECKRYIMHNEIVKITVEMHISY